MRPVDQALVEIGLERLVVPLTFWFLPIRRLLSGMSKSRKVEPMVSNATR